jgi:hypothetical protein
MSVIKLNRTHSQAVKCLFDNPYYMGQKIEDNTEFKVNPAILKTTGQTQTTAFNTVLYGIFCSNYLSNLKNFHAFGYLKDNQVKAMISFYESTEEPAWYYTIYRSTGDNTLLRDVLDKVIDYNEQNGRNKFYTLVHQRHSRLLRKFHWSKYNDERYGYFDEILVPGKTKCVYTNHFELLFKRFVLPEDSVVRCNYLKQEYRTTLPIGGNI